MHTEIYTKEEIKLFRKLNTPSKIQDYLNSIPFNFEENGDTCMSPREVIRHNIAHCMEGAMLAFLLLEFHGYAPRIMDLRSVKKPYDDDHVVVVFKQFGCFGAISKTNHGVLRYREPIYKTIRELALSYFHEYFLHTGVKTLREYSRLFDLNHFNYLHWRTTENDLTDIPLYIDEIRHYPLLSHAQIKNLRLADPVEIEMGKIVEYQKRK